MTPGFVIGLALIASGAFIIGFVFGRDELAWRQFKAVKRENDDYRQAEREHRANLSAWGRKGALAKNASHTQISAKEAERDKVIAVANDMRSRQPGKGPIVRSARS